MLRAERPVANSSGGDDFELPDGVDDELRSRIDVGNLAEKHRRHRLIAIGNGSHKSRPVGAVPDVDLVVRDPGLIEARYKSGAERAPGSPVDDRFDR